MNPLHHGVDRPHLTAGKDPENLHRRQGPSFELSTARGTEDQCFLAFYSTKCSPSGKGPVGEGKKPHIRVNDQSSALLINGPDSHGVKRNLKGSTPAQMLGLGEEKSRESFMELRMKENL